MDVNKLVDSYIELRDKKAKIKAEYDLKVAEVDTVLDKIEAALLRVLNDTGVDSMRATSGTAYKSVRTSATVADWDAFLTFVKSNEAWEMLERRAAKSAVEQYKAANEDLPPGLNYREEVVVNIRRS